MRTVGAKLNLDVKDYVHGADEAEKRTGRVKDKLEDLGQEGTRAGTKVSVAGQKMKAATAGLKDNLEDSRVASIKLGQTAFTSFQLSTAAARHLDEQIEETAREVQRLEAAFRKTGDLKLFAQLGKEFGKLKQQLKARDLFNPSDMLAAGVKAGTAAAPGVISGLTTKLSTSAGGLGPAALAIGAPIAVGVAGIVGAATAGAIIGGAGVGGIAGGLAIASKHQAVKAEAAQFGASISQLLQRSAVAFVPAGIEGLQILRGEIGKMEKDLRAIFSKSATFVAPLARGLGGMSREVLAGIRVLVDQAEPVINSIAAGMVRLGKAVRDGLESLSDNAYDGARALTLLFAVVEVGVNIVFGLVNTLAELYGWMEKLGAVFTHDSGRLAALVTEQDKAKGSSGELTKELLGLLDGFEESGAAAGAAAVEVESFSDALKRMQDENLAAMNSEIAFEAAVDDAAASLKENGKTLDVNTAKGRANMTSLLGMASAAKRNAADIQAMTGSEDLAAAATERGRAAFVKQATAMGMSAVKARELANQLFGIPRNVKTNASFQGDNKGVSNWKRTLSGIPREIFTSARLRAIVNVEVRREQATQATGRRWGGVTVHAQDGVLRQAAVYSPVATARYAFAERATGGEAFVPRFGDFNRSVGILQQAASWYGMQVGPRGGGGGAPTRVVLELRSSGSRVDNLLLEVLRGAISDRGGNVQAVVGS